MGLLEAPHDGKRGGRGASQLRRKATGACSSSWVACVLLWCLSGMTTSIPASVKGRGTLCVGNCLTSLYKFARLLFGVYPPDRNRRRHPRYRSVCGPSRCVFVVVVDLSPSALKTIALGVDEICSPCRVAYHRDESCACLPTGGPPTFFAALLMRSHAVMCSMFLPHERRLLLFGAR